MRIPLRYTSACRDSSGYAAAARQYILALQSSGAVDLSLRVASFEPTKVLHSSFETSAEGLFDRENHAKIQIVHLTPENFPSYRVNGLYNIAYTAWETEKLPVGWADLLNTMEEVWVPSQWNKDVFKDSGVTKPIYVVPHVIEPPSISVTSDLNFPVMGQDSYMFYSIFQWIERKNPAGLLKAYFTEFGPEDSAYMVLKTYRIDASPAERQAVRAELNAIKKMLNLTYYPPVIFFGELLTRNQIQYLHHKCDCYVSLQRGEGFGIPLAEAMSYGKPVVTTNYGGCIEFMNKDNSFLVPAQRTPVSGMIFKNYNGNMVWGEPDIMEARKLMRYCYENRQAARQVGQKAAIDIKNNYNEKVISQIMIDRLNEIMRGLNS